MKDDGDLWMMPKFLVALYALPPSSPNLWLFFVSHRLAGSVLSDWQGLVTGLLSYPYVSLGLGRTVPTKAGYNVKL